MKIWASMGIVAAATICSPRFLPFLGRTVGSARGENISAITGGRPPSDPGHFTFQYFDDLEARLREDLNDGEDEVFALLSGGYWGDAGQIVVRVRTNKAQLVFMPDRTRTFERSLRADELKGLRAFLTGIKVFNLQALTNNIADGRKVDGDFSPLPGVLKTPLQPAGDKTVWTVKTDRRKQISIVGRYDLEKFVFTPVRELRGLAFGTNDVWVNEAAGQAYAVYDGDLVRFSLNP